MSETPEEERPAAAPPSEPVPPIHPAPPPAPATRPAGRPMYQNRGFQFAAVGVAGLVLGGLIGLGVGVASGVVIGHHDRGDRGDRIRPEQQHWGPDRQPQGRRPVPYMPPRKQPGFVNPSRTPPSPQAS